MYLPGVSLAFSKRGLIPKLYCGVVSNLTFSGQYVPGAENCMLPLHNIRKSNTKCKVIF